MAKTETRTTVVDEEQPIEILDGSEALAVLNRSEIDVQIATAKRYPRSISVFRQQAEEMATLDEETAGSMFYALPRAGKTIEGPSVRLAEVVGSAWGNIRYAARTVSIDEKYVTAQGVAYDLEKNVFSMIEVKRRITDRMNRRYEEDMIGVTANAAQSIAIRNAIFKVVPFAYVKRIYEKAKEVSIGKALTMEQRRTRALEWYAKIGASEAIVLKLLNRKDVTEITIEDLVVLQGLHTAIHDGETTIEQALRDAGVIVSKLERVVDEKKKQDEAKTNGKGEIKHGETGRVDPTDGRRVEGPGADAGAHDAGTGGPQSGARGGKEDDGGGREGTGREDPQGREVDPGRPAEGRAVAVAAPTLSGLLDVLNTLYAELHKTTPPDKARREREFLWSRYVGPGVDVEKADPAKVQKLIDELTKIRDKKSVASR